MKGTQMGYITGEQFRAARAMLGWEQSELAQRANISVKTVKRLEATAGPVEAHSEWGVKNALELGGVEFVGDHDWRERNDGVRFVKDRTGKLRRDIVEDVSRWLDVTLKIKTEKDADFFERSNSDITEAIISEMREAVERTVKEKLKCKQ
jgi:transcriptional regulator with XRE-family HTH domain